MKNFFLLFITTIFLIGCGGGGGGGDTSTSTSTTTSDVNIPTESYAGTSFDTWDYIVPNTSTVTTKSISSNSIDGTSYTATFKSIEENSMVEEIPDNTTDERVIYQKENDSISVTFYKNDTKVYDYDMKRYVKVGEPTIENSSCMLVNYLTKYTPPNSSQTYSDVIEIDCGKHKGFYARGEGQIYQE